MSKPSTFIGIQSLASQVGTDCGSESAVTPVDGINKQPALRATVVTLGRLIQK